MASFEALKHKKSVARALLMRKNGCMLKILLFSPVFLYFYGVKPSWSYYIRFNVSKSTIFKNSKISNFNVKF